MGVSNGEESGVVYQDVVMITRLIVCESGEKEVRIAAIKRVGI